jgi:leucyl-tRNA synthetase
MLYDSGYLGFVEPFMRLLNQGMVINKGAALSKSRGNVVEPLPLIERFGADTPSASRCCSPDRRTRTSTGRPYRRKAPHIAEELWWEAFGHRESVFAAGWPAFDPSLAREESMTLVVQVDGRVRDRLDVPPSIGEDEAREPAMTAGEGGVVPDGPAGGARDRPCPAPGQHRDHRLSPRPRVGLVVAPVRPEGSPNVTDDTDGASTLR